MKPQALRDWRVILLAPQFLLLLSCTELQSVSCPSGFMCPAGQKCAASQDVCIKDDCGDGVVQANEACDDGNLQDGDGCRRDCQSLEVCGDGETDKGERCDDGNTASGDGCSADCKSTEYCGNSYVDASRDEQCDDGNDADGDGCSANCGSDESCGNGLKDKHERCDDGNNVDGDGCSADCQSNERCGNSVVDAATEEKCDDGNDVGGDGCSADCRSNEKCGNGVVDAATEEKCDDGNNLSGDGCSSDCRSEEGCGNGIRDLDEECDDGNAFNDDNCLTSCVLSTCGDGYVDRAAPGVEACDDGNSLACGTCSEGCMQVQRPDAARGRIRAVAPDLLSDGEIFAISDGRIRVFFEFNKTGTVPSAHELVDIEHLPEKADATDVARVIFEAIEKVRDHRGAPGKLRLWSGRPDATTISLGAVTPGPHGNQAIIESVEDNDFLVEGMHAGAGHDCPPRTLCMSNADCSATSGNGQCMRGGNERVGFCGGP